MSLRTFARRLLSLTAARDFWSQPEHAASNKARLNLEVCEDRSVPATVQLTNGGTQLLIVPDTANEKIHLTPMNATALSVSVQAGLTVTTGVNPSTMTNILVDGTKNNTAFTFDATAQANNTNLPMLKQVVVKTGTGAKSTIDYSMFNFGPATGTGTAPSVYFVTQFGGAGTYKAPIAGASVIQFVDQSQATGLNVDTSAAGPSSMTFFDFGNVSSAVAVTLNVQMGGLLASYANSQVALLGGTTASLYGARGGRGDNTFVSSGVQDQYFIGGFGNNTFSLSGAGKTVEVASIYDLSPSLAGVLQTSGNYAGTYGLSLNSTDLASASDIVDLTQFQSKASAFAANDTNLFKTASTLFAKFGMFDMGGNAPGFASNPKQSITAPQLSGNFNVTVSAGVANADVFGYANVALTAVGGGGNNDFESATGALSSFLSAGGGTSLLEGNAGDTLVGGSGKTTIQFFADQASATRVTRLVGGTGTGSVSATSPFITVDVGTGTYDLNGIINDASVILLYDHQTTLNGANIAANPGLIPSAVQKITR